MKEISEIQRDKYLSQLKRTSSILLKDSMLMKPSYQHLIDEASIVQQIASEVGQSANIPKKHEIRTASLVIDIEIFQVDIPGELAHDYRNSNKRYKEKWNKQYDKLRTFIDQLHKVVSDFNY